MTLYFEIFNILIISTSQHHLPTFLYKTHITTHLIIVHQNFHENIFINDGEENTHFNPIEFKKYDGVVTYFEILFISLIFN